jgi:hypothetical protein
MQRFVLRSLIIASTARANPSGVYTKLGTWELRLQALPINIRL